MAPHYNFEYEFNEALIDRVADAFLRHQKKKAPLNAKFWKGLLVMLFCTVLFGTLTVFGILTDLPMVIMMIPILLLGFFGCLLSLALILISTAFAVAPFSRWIIRRRLLSFIPHSYDRTIRWTFADENFGVKTTDVDRQLPWSAIRRLYQEPDFWFLGVQNGPDLILPVETLNNEVKEFILSKTADVCVSAQSVPINSGAVESSMSH